MATRLRRAVRYLRKRFWPELFKENRAARLQQILDEVFEGQKDLAEFNPMPQEGRRDSIGTAPFFYTKKYKNMPTRGKGIWGKARFVNWLLFYFIPVSLVNYSVILLTRFIFNIAELILRSLGSLFRFPSDRFIRLAFDDISGYSIPYLFFALVCSPFWIVGKLFQLAADFVNQLHHLFSLAVVLYWGIIQLLNAIPIIGLGIVKGPRDKDSFNYREIFHPRSVLLNFAKTIGIAIVLAAAPVLAVFVFLPMLSLAVAILATIATALVAFMGYSLVKAIKRAYPSDDLRSLNSQGHSRNASSQPRQTMPFDAYHVPINGMVWDAVPVAGTDRYCLEQRDSLGTVKKLCLTDSGKIVYLTPQLQTPHGMISVIIGGSSGPTLNGKPYYYCYVSVPPTTLVPQPNGIGNDRQPEHNRSEHHPDPSASSSAARPLSPTSEILASNADRPPASDALAAAALRDRPGFPPPLTSAPVSGSESVIGSDLPHPPFQPSPSAS